MIRVAHLIHTFPPAVHGGGEAFVYELSKNLAAMGQQAHVVTRGFKGLPSMERMDGFLVHRYPNPAPERAKYHPVAKTRVPWYDKYLALGLDVPFSVKKLTSLVRSYRLDLIHASFILPSGLSGVLVKSITGTPLVVTVHGNADFYEVPTILNPALRYTLERGDRIVAVGAELMDNLTRALGDVNGLVIPNGIDAKRFREPTDRKRTRRRYGLDTKAPVLISVSRLVERKNIDLLIRSAPLVLKEHPDCKFMIVGEGPEERRLRLLTESLGLSSSVIFTGFTSEEEKIRLYNASDAFVQLSSREGLSVSLLESKAAGLPAVVAGFSGTREPVKQGEDGLIVKPPLTTENITERISSLLSDPEAMRRMGRKASEEAEEEYSVLRMTERYLKVYKSVCGAE